MSRSWAPLRYAPFRYLAAGRTVAMAGNGIAPIALAFAVLDMTGSAADLGLVVAARSAAMAVFLLFGGVVADRLPRQRVMVVAALAAGVSQAGAATLMLTHTATVTRLMVFAAVNGTAAAFTFPASSALVPQTVPAELRVPANALNRLGANAAMIVGSSVGGLFVVAFGSGWGLAIDATTFGVAALLYCLVRVDGHREGAGPAGGPLRELREGWREFAGRRWVWVVVAAFCLLNAAFAGGFAVLGPTVADATFGRAAWGFVLAAQTAGMVAGAFIALRLRVRRLLHLGVVCCAATPMMLAALALSPVAAVLIGLSFVAGIAIEQFGVAWEVSLQEHVPADRLARVYSYDALGSLMAVPVGQAVAGPLATAVGTRPALLAAAALAAASVLAMAVNRSVRDLRHQPAATAAPLPLAADPQALPDAATVNG